MLQKYSANNYWNQEKITCCSSMYHFWDKVPNYGEKGFKALDNYGTYFKFQAPSQNFIYVYMSIVSKSDIQ